MHIGHRKSCLHCLSREYSIHVLCCTHPSQNEVSAFCPPGTFTLGIFFQNIVGFPHVPNLAQHIQYERVTIHISGDCHDVCTRVSQDHLRTGRLLPHLHICPWHPPHQRSQRLQDQRSLSQLFCRL